MLWFCIYKEKLWITQNDDMLLDLPRKITTKMWKQTTKGTVTFLNTRFLLWQRRPTLRTFLNYVRIAQYEFRPCFDHCLREGRVGTQIVPNFWLSVVSLSVFVLRIFEQDKDVESSICQHGTTDDLSEETKGEQDCSLYRKKKEDKQLDDVRYYEKFQTSNFKRHFISAKFLVHLHKSFNNATYLQRS